MDMIELVVVGAFLLAPVGILLEYLFRTPPTPVEARIEPVLNVPPRGIEGNETKRAA